MSTTSRPIERPRVAVTARGRRNRQLLATWLIRLGVLALCVIVLLPVLYIVSSSLQPGSSAFATSLLPTRIGLDNYAAIIGQGFWTWARNSMIICTIAGLVQLTVNTLGAYAFSRLRFRGRRFGLIALVLIQMFPSTLALSAIYVLLVNANLLDTLLGLILVFVGGSAFYIWLLKNYMDTIPRELDESAIIDGANSWTIFWRIILPLMRPMLATQFIFSFQATFSDFIFSSTILKTQDNLNIAVGLYNLTANGTYETNWAQFSAGAVMASLPLLLIFLLLQRQLVSGLAAGAVKG